MPSTPTLRDAYWLSVNQGMVDEAKRLGVKLQIHEAGGYGALVEQRHQLQRCVQEGSNAIMLGAVSYQGLREAITATQLPLFGLVNDLPTVWCRPRWGSPGTRWAGKSATGWRSVTARRQQAGLGRPLPRPAGKRRQ